MGLFVLILGYAVDTGYTAHIELYCLYAVILRI